MARTKTTTYHLEIRCSCRSAATATATVVPPATTPPLALVFSPPSLVAPRLLPPLIPPISGTIPSSSVHQPIVAASEGPSTTAIPTRVTSQGEFDEEDTGLNLAVSPRTV
ncbi:hypothetical protein Fot_20049 [Forsythia ovata]|uniref:Uncharacterized protein n=1 Tax=Forsythia ovata TaxID=205694 RepID=A0ABD1VPF7_9LAMI